MTNRTSKMLFKESFVWLVKLCLSLKANATPNSQVLQCQNPLINCLDIYTLSEAIICGNVFASAKYSLKHWVVGIFSLLEVI